MEKISDMDWAQDIKIGNAQNLWRCNNKAKQTTFARLNSKRNLVKHFYKPYIITENL